MGKSFKKVLYKRVKKC